MNHETRILYHFIYLLYLFKLNHSGGFTLLFLATLFTVKLGGENNNNEPHI